jgi:hypothetical protein
MVHGQALRDLPLFSRIKGLHQRILLLFAIAFLWVHWSACGQFLAAAIRGFPENSWVVRGDVEFLDPAAQHIWALFKSVSVSQYNSTRSLFFLYLTNLYHRMLYVRVITQHLVCIATFFFFSFSSPE